MDHRLLKHFIHGAFVGLAEREVFLFVVNKVKRILIRGSSVPRVLVSVRVSLLSVSKNGPKIEHPPLIFTLFITNFPTLPTATSPDCHHKFPAFTLSVLSHRHRQDQPPLSQFNTPEPTKGRTADNHIPAVIPSTHPSRQQCCAIRSSSHSPKRHSVQHWLVQRAYPSPCTDGDTLRPCRNKSRVHF